MTATPRWLACFLLSSIPVFAQGQSLAISPQQVYVISAQETFVTLTGTNLTGTASTLVAFSGNGIAIELEPNTATSTTLEVWIPLEVAYASGAYSVTVKATDVAQPMRTIGPVTFSVVERSINGPPQLSLPEVVVSDANTTGGAYVTFDAGGASCDHASGSFFPYGTTTVTCSASNAFGATTGTFSVVVSNPASPPSFTLPEVLIVEATSPAGAVVTFNASGASCDHESGATYPIGDTSVTCSATNSVGTTTVIMTVAVLDTTAPALNLPSNITSGNHVVSFSATATDIVDGSVTPVCTPSSGSTFPDGPTTVSCTATDSSSNSASGAFTVTVVAAQLSDFSASQNVYQLDASSNGSVTYTSNVPLPLTETLTIRSDVTGQTIRTLFSGTRSAGTYQDVWNGTNDAGQLVPDGTYRYLITVSANGSTFTWDDSTRYVGTTLTQLPYAKCRNSAGTLVSCNDASISFDPYTNKPLRVNYCVGGGEPPACTAGNTPFLVIGKAVNGTETDEICRPTDCFFSEYQSAGSHEVLWYGRGYDGGAYLANATGLTVIRRNDNWPRSRTLVYGTAPVVATLAIPWPVFNPSAATTSLNGAEFRLNITTFQSRLVTVTGEFKNLTSGSVLRTLTTPTQTAGQVVLNWNGRADNTAWVAPGLYEVKLTITDSAGSSTVLRPLITVRYE